MASLAPACTARPSLDPPAQPPSPPPKQHQPWSHVTLPQPDTTCCWLLGSLPTTLWPPCPQETLPSLGGFCAALASPGTRHTSPALPPTGRLSHVPRQLRPDRCLGNSVSHPHVPRRPSWSMCLLPGASLDLSFSLTCPASDKTWWWSGSETPPATTPVGWDPPEPRSLAPVHPALGAGRVLNTNEVSSDACSKTWRNYPLPTDLATH